MDRLMSIIVRARENAPGRGIVKDGLWGARP